MIWQHFFNKFLQNFWLKFCCYFAMMVSNLVSQWSFSLFFMQFCDVRVYFAQKFVRIKIRVGWITSNSCTIKFFQRVFSLSFSSALSYLVWSPSSISIITFWSTNQISGFVPLNVLFSNTFSLGKSFIVLLAINCSSWTITSSRFYPNLFIKSIVSGNLQPSIT